MAAQGVDSAAAGLEVLAKFTDAERESLVDLKADRRALDSRLKELGVSKLGDRCLVATVVQSMEKGAAISGPPAAAPEPASTVVPASADAAEAGPQPAPSEAAAPDPTGASPSEEEEKYYVPPDLEGTPFAFFHDPNIWDKLARHPDTRPYILDAGFRANVEKMRQCSAQQAAGRGMDDPRIMQAIIAMQGNRLTVTEDELKHAEVAGNMPRRDPVQMPHLEAAWAHKTTQDAKDAGNAHYKAERFSEALACYQRALHIESQGAADEAVRVTVHSNCAAALLKLRRPNEALQSCGLALIEPPKEVRILLANNGVLSKVHYRKALAHEMLRQFEEAVKAMEISISVSGEPSRLLQTEMKRLQKLREKGREEEKEAKLQVGRDAEAEVKRGAGITLSNPPPPGEGAMQKVDRTLAKGYVREIDYAHWAKNWLSEHLLKVKISEGGCKIKVTDLKLAQSEVHASVKLKHGKRSLFYDLSLVMGWDASTTLGGGGKMSGICRLYNIGQDTRFNPGGDKETCWMYELGFPQEFYGQSAPWAEQIKAEAADLFHAAAEVLERWIKALTSKAEQEAV